MRKILLSVIIICLAFVNTEAQNFDIYKGDTVNYINKNKHKEGHWIILKKGTDKIIQEGKYLQGKKDGLWTAYYSNGQKKSVITYLQGEKKGPAKIYFENENLAEEGTWQIDKWVGKYKTYYRNGKLSFSWNYNEKGTRSGYQQYFYENGKIKIEGEWEDGKEKGIIREYYSSGVLKAEKTFSDGNIDINIIKKEELSENETEIIDNSIKDTNKTILIKPDTVKFFSGSGYHVFYNKEKKIEKDGIFSNGILINGKHYIYDENGVLIKTAIYKDGKINEIINNENPD